MSKKLKSLLMASFLLQTLTACGDTNTGSTSSASKDPNADFSMLLPGSSVSSVYYQDLNDHPESTALESITGKVVDYIGLTSGEESLSFKLMLSTKDIPDLLKINLEQEYGGVDEAMKDGLTLDINDLVAEYAPNFMEKLQEIPDYEKVAYTDSGYLAQFGATMVEEEMRGLPFYGPMINQDYLKQTGLDVPQTIGEWEIMLEAFHDLGIVPFTFAGSGDFSALYDCFASAFGVTAGSGYYQVDGQVKYSPMEVGYYDFVSLFQTWYANGWLAVDFFDKSQTDVEKAFGAGEVGATICHINGGQYYKNLADNHQEFVPAPYPVLAVGDVISTRHYTPDFITDPIFVYDKAENPIDLIQWVDYFYSDEGIQRTNWGIEGQTFQIDEDGTFSFTSAILEDPLQEAPILLMAEQTFQELKMVADWDYESQYYPDNTEGSAFALWGQANYDHAMPQYLTYNLEERNIFTVEMEKLPVYVYESTVSMILGELSLSYYEKFQETLLSLCAEEFLEIHQTAYDRYENR